MGGGGGGGFAEYPERLLIYNAGKGSKYFFHYLFLLPDLGSVLRVEIDCEEGDMAEVTK